MSRLLTFLKGMGMGAADIVPGVSGGTIAFITGIYTRLVDGIAYFNRFFKFSEGNFLEKAKGIDWELFIPLLSGIALSFILFANILERLLVEEVALTYSFFFGLIAASSVVLIKHLDRVKFSSVVFLILGMAAGSFISSADTASMGHGTLALFFSGMIAINAMILPGISGSFILLLLGQYEFVISAIKSLDLGIIFIFGLGAASGLLLFSNLLDYLLHNKRNETMSTLIGLMIGSLMLPGRKIYENMDGMTGVIITAIIGAVLVFALEKLSDSMIE